MAILNSVADKLSADVINAAIEGFEAQKSRIDVQIADLRAMLSRVRPDASVKSPGRAPRRKMSAAARKRIGDAQRKRWAAQGNASAKKAAKPKRKLSAAGRANIVAALKKRWAARKSGLVVANKAAPRNAASRQGQKVAAKAA